MKVEDAMTGIVVCAEASSWQQAGRFATRLLGGAELRTFEDLRRHAPIQPVLVYLTHPDYDHIRTLLENLKPATPDVVIYYASRPAPQDAVRLGKLVGETRPNHTSVVFEAKAAAASMLQHSRPPQRNGSAGPSASRIRELRERFGVTQTELAHALGVSLRTVQNWERSGVVSKPRLLRDPEELWTVLKDSLKPSDIPVWLRSKNDAFGGHRPIDLLNEGHARDLIVEFRRLQAGEPV
jgi:DNA-binding transcriptional regulator YiaG